MLTFEYLCVTLLLDAPISSKFQLKQKGYGRNETMDNTPTDGGSSPIPGGLQ